MFIFSLFFFLISFSNYLINRDSVGNPRCGYFYVFDFCSFLHANINLSINKIKLLFSKTTYITRDIYSTQ